MSETTKWIKEQLKKGHSKDQIIEFLYSKGYPIEVINEVNSASTNRNKKLLAVALLLLVILALSQYFMRSEDSLVLSVTDSSYLLDPNNPFLVRVVVDDNIVVQTIQGRFVSINGNLLTLSSEKGNLSVKLSENTEFLRRIYFSKGNYTSSSTGSHSLSAHQHTVVQLKVNSTDGQLLQSVVIGSIFPSGLEVFDY